VEPLKKGGKSVGLDLWQGFLFCNVKITLNWLYWFTGEFMSFLTMYVVVQLDETEHNRINTRKTLSLGLFYCFFFPYSFNLLIWGHPP